MCLWKSEVLCECSDEVPEFLVVMVKSVVLVGYGLWKREKLNSKERMRMVKEKEEVHERGARSNFIYSRKLSEDGSTY